MTSPLELWRLLGVREGGRYLVHSNLALCFGQAHVRNSQGILESLLKAVGNEGSVVLPAFTYSKYPHPPFDRDSDFGLDKMGALSMASREFGFRRTSDPMFSLLLHPNLSFDLEPSANKSFGNGSTFGKLVDLDYEVISLGVGAGSTIIHELERRVNVPYRSDIWVAANVRTPNGPVVLPWRIYARDLRDSAAAPNFSKLTYQARNLPFVSTARGSHALGFRYRIGNMFQHLKSELQISPDFLIRGLRS